MKNPSQTSRQSEEYIFDLAEEGEKRFSDPYMDAVDKSPYGFPGRA